MLVEIHQRTGLRINLVDGGFQVHDAIQGLRIFTSLAEAKNWCENLYYAYN